MRTGWAQRPHEFVVLQEVRKHRFTTDVASHQQLICTTYLRNTCRVPTHPWKSLKVLEFFSPKFKALKVLENRTGAWRSLNFIPQVLESPWIHQVKLCNISNSVKQVFRLKQDLLIIVTFCFYQLKLSRNHKNRYCMLL